MASHLGALRIITGILIAAWLTPVLAAGLVGLGLPIAAAVALAVVAAGAATTWAVWMRHGADWILDVLLAGPRIWLVVLIAAAIAACAWNGRLTVFMIDTSRVDCSYIASDTFRSGHSCFSAYSEAARFAMTGDVNIYESTLYAPGTTAGPRRLIGGNLRVDPYHYPPPFLLLPAALRLVTPEFLPERAIWFTLQALLLAAAIVMVSRWIGGVPGAWTAALGWLVLASPATLMTLQAGNFQVTVYALAMIAFVLVSPVASTTASPPGSIGRELIGAALLAYGAVGKIVPGILVLFLLAARRWRIVIYTAALSLILCLITIAAFGWKPFSDFIWYEMPKIASGAAFPQTERAPVVTLNLSVYGETARLRRLATAWLGLNILGPEAGRSIASIYGLVVVLLTAAAGWLAGTGTASRIRLAQLALALLSLMAFRSPFVGSLYGFLGTMWLLTLLAAEASTTRARVGWLAAFLLLAAAIVVPPSPGAPPNQVSPGLAWIAVTSVAFSSVLLLNLGVVVRVLVSAWREREAKVPLGAAALATDAG